MSSSYPSRGDARAGKIGSSAWSPDSSGRTLANIFNPGREGNVPSTAMKSAAPATEYRKSIRKRKKCVNHFRDQRVILVYIQKTDFSPTPRPDLAVFTVKSRKPSNCLNMNSPAFAGCPSALSEP
uniref:Uncharacterized protein n=1 Tax=Anopheles atroparvus TaxID=41427 RepID=A0A182J409_ANOAO